jgi:cobalt-precorrin 5A hydrolase/precorrin-3B C17-methyltransferase
LNLSLKLLTQFQPIAAIATTPSSAQTLKILAQSQNITLWLPESCKGIADAQFYSGSLQEHLKSIWQQHRAFVFCLAVGAVVRLISPLLADKSSDPAIVVIDREERYVISLTSGHQGGADLLADLIARQIGATPIITGASASLNLPGIDILGVPFGWRKGEGDWTGVSSAIARQEPVQIIQEVGSTLWQEQLPQGHPFLFGFAEPNDPSIKPQARVWISATKRRFDSQSDFPKVQWHPRVLWLGIGCERGTSIKLIEKAIEQTCQRHHLATAAIAGIATIDLKADEPGILELCQQWNLPLKTFSAQLLSQVRVPTPSPVVNQEVGTPSVAEAAAILAINREQGAGSREQGVGSREQGAGSREQGAGSREQGAGSRAQEGFVLNSLLVPKQIYKQEGESGAVTIAIAQANLEYTGRQGSLYLVGIGPGSLEQITPAAKVAIAQADAIIGYSLYIDLIKPITRSGQIIESLPITQERQRAQRAIELAQWGLTVAVISSGDCGIYGMAGLVLEELQAWGWDGNLPSVQVFPGITALQAAAARVGAPLMHDFCAISLSDLLTPWQVIEKRLEVAAIGDFVTAIYNPRSQTRIQQIGVAQQIFLQHRHPNTPVAIVRSVYRQDEAIELTTLEKMLEAPIDMLTVILIGNSSTRNYVNWMITPRGYLP